MSRRSSFPRRCLCAGRPAVVILRASFVCTVLSLAPILLLLLLLFVGIFPCRSCLWVEPLHLVPLSRYEAQAGEIAFSDATLRPDASLQPLVAKECQGWTLESLWSPGTAGFLAAVFVRGAQRRVAMFNEWNNPNAEVCMLDEDELDLHEEDDSDDESNGSAGFVNGLAAGVSVMAFQYIPDWCVHACQAVVLRAGAGCCGRGLVTSCCFLRQGCHHCDNECFSGHCDGVLAASSQRRRR